MDQTCPRCNALSPNTCRYCRSCGMMLGATLVQGRTVVVGSPLAAHAASHAAGRPVAGCVATAPGFSGVANLPPVVDSPPQRRELTSIVHDHSGSMGELYDDRYTKLEASQRAGGTLVLEKARLDPDDEISIIAFSHVATEVLPLCPIREHKPRILEAIQSLAVDGGTDINEGLMKARDGFQWDRRDVVRRVVLLTDGHGGHPLATADDLKKRGVIIDVIGVGATPEGVDEELLKEIASMVEGELRYRFIKDTKTLVDHYTQLANKTAVCA